MGTVIRIGSKSGREQVECVRGGKYGTEVILAIMAVEGNRRRMQLYFLNAEGAG